MDTATAPDLEALAAELKAAEDAARQLPTFTSRYPAFGNDHGYDVARRVHRRRMEEGHVPAGRKIGFTNTTIWETYGVHEPMWGTMYGSTCVRADDSAARCSLERYRSLCEPRIEPEIMFCLRRAPTSQASPEEILDCVEWMAHGFEIVHTHFPGWKFQAADTKADNGLHGALFVGAPKMPKELGSDLVAKLASFRIELLRDGEVRDRGTGANVLGSPLLALRHLLAVLEKDPKAPPLQPGEVVTTGTLTDAQPVRPGETWTTRLAGLPLPPMRLAFEA
jgi:2-oxo-3-hexenedioate decarboxylase